MWNDCGTCPFAEDCEYLKGDKEMKLTIHKPTGDEEYLVPRDELDRFVEDKIPRSTYFTIHNPEIGMNYDRTYITKAETPV